MKLFTINTMVRKILEKWIKKAITQMNQRASMKHLRKTNASTDTMAKEKMTGKKVAVEKNQSPIKKEEQ